MLFGKVSQFAHPLCVAIPHGFPAGIGSVQPGRAGTLSFLSSTRIPPAVSHRPLGRAPPIR